MTVTHVLIIIKIILIYHSGIKGGRWYSFLQGLFSFKHANLALVWSYYCVRDSNTGTGRKHFSCFSLTQQSRKSGAEAWNKQNRKNDWGREKKDDWSNESWVSRQSGKQSKGKEDQDTRARDCYYFVPFQTIFEKVPGTRSKSKAYEVGRGFIDVAIWWVLPAQWERRQPKVAQLLSCKRHEVIPTFAFKALWCRH